ncbi:MAG: succinyl-CoA synthetase subunit beta [Pseudomonadota bacterium]
MARAALIGMALTGLTGHASADPAVDAFAAHCFSPLMTAARAAEVFSGLRYDFYDLDPLVAANAPSAPSGRAVTQGTDRRCELAFDGDAVALGAAAVLEALEREGITAPADVPPDFPRAAGAKVVAARFLNPRRIAVVQIGTRPGPNGIETFLNVERLEPLS